MDTTQPPTEPHRDDTAPDEDASGSPSRSEGAVVEHMIEQLETVDPAGAPDLADEIATRLAADLDGSTSTVYEPEQLRVIPDGTDGEVGS